MKKSEKKILIILIVVIILILLGYFVVYPIIKYPKNTNTCNTYGTEWKYNQEKEACCNEKTNECIDVSVKD